jgi:hypothetical protein
MTTSYDDIFQKFMHEIDDFDLTSLTEEQMNVENKLTLSKAVVLFKKCKTSLERDDDTEVFLVDKTEEEMWILADYMRKVWLDEKINNGELLKLRLTDKDFKTFSPSNQLETMMKLKLVYDKELKLKVNDYLYDGYSFTNFYSSGGSSDT